MGPITSAYDALPRWLTVAFWVALSTVVSAAINALQTGAWAVNPVYIPLVNIALVAIKDGANTLAEKTK